MSKYLGYWKFNSQLLIDQTYVNIIDRTIQEAVKEYRENGNADDLSTITLSCDAQAFLEILKCKIRSATTQHPVAISRNRKETEMNLESEIRNLREELDDIDDVESYKIMKEKETELEQIRKIKMRAVILRSKARRRKVYGLLLQIIKT